MPTTTVPRKPSAQALTVLLLLLPGLCAARLAQWLMPFGAATSPDSLNYLLAAQNVARGLGVKVPDTSPYGHGLVSLYLWPPLYPTWLSAFLRAGNDAVQMIALSNGILLAVLGYLLFLLFRRHLNTAAAVAYSVIALLMPGIQLLFTYAWSETLCLPLLIGTLLALRAFGDGVAAHAWRRALAWLGLACAIAALMIWTRYAAVTFVPLLGITAGWYCRRFTPLQRLGVGALSMGVTAALTAPLLIHNWLHSGHLSGGDRGNATRPVLAAIANVWHSCDAYFFGDTWWMPVLLVLATAANRRLHGQAQRDGSIDSIALPALWLFGYLALILLLGRFQSIDDDARMIALMTPMLPWAALLLKSEPPQPEPRRVSSFMIPILWCLCTLIQALPSLQLHHELWLTRGSPRFERYSGPGEVYNNFTRNSENEPTLMLGDALRRQGPPAAVYIDINPLPFGLLTGIDAHGLPDQIDGGQFERLTQAAPPGSMLVLTDPARQQEWQRRLGPDWPGTRRIDLDQFPELLVVTLDKAAPPGQAR